MLCMCCGVIEKDQFKLKTGHIAEKSVLREPTQSHFRISLVRGALPALCVFTSFRTGSDT